MVTRRRGTPKQHATVPFLQSLVVRAEVEFPYMQDVGLQCREEEWSRNSSPKTNEGLALVCWRCVRQSEVSPEETLYRWNNIVSRGPPAHWLREREKHRCIQAFLFKSQSLTIIGSCLAGLCVQSGVSLSHDPVQWKPRINSDVCSCQQSEHFAQHDMWAVKRAVYSTSAKKKVQQHVQTSKLVDQ